jgi:hypothetical protein
MKRGELRRFKDSIDPDESKDGPIAGQTFVVIALYVPPSCASSSALVDFLIGGRLETGWNRSWIGRHSEVLDVVE